MSSLSICSFESVSFYMFKTLLLGILVCMDLYVGAQTPPTYNASDAPVQKNYNDWLFQFNPRVDVLLKDNRTSLYLEGLINSKYAYASIIENYRWNAKLGIDYAASETWYVGIFTRLNNNSSGIYNYCTRLYGQHRGKIGPLLFSQELLYEQFNFTEGTLTTINSSGLVYSRRPAEGRVCIGFGLGKYFAVGHNQVAVFASYRPYLQFIFKNDGQLGSLYNDRWIDYTSLRLDVGYLIHKQLYIGLYGARDTNFGYRPAAVPYRSNDITPIVGLACNMLIFAGADKEKEGTNAFTYFYTR